MAPAVAAKQAQSEDLPDRPRGIIALVNRAWQWPLDLLGTTILLAFRTLLWLVRPPYRIGQFVASMDFIGVQSLFIIALTGTFSGMVFALQTVYGFRRFSAEGMVGGVVALSLTREI